MAVHRGKNLLVSAEAAALLNPICRAETDRVRAEDPGWRRLLDHLARVGPSTTEDLRTELSLKRQELKALRSPLERCGVIVARSIAMTSGRDHADERRWRRRSPARHRTVPLGPGLSGPARRRPPSSDPAEALADLVVAAVRAAVLAPEPELRRWFSWPWYWTDTLIDDLVRAGRLRRLDAHIAIPSPA